MIEVRRETLEKIRKYFQKSLNTSVKITPIHEEHRATNERLPYPSYFMAELRFDPGQGRPAIAKSTLNAMKEVAALGETPEDAAENLIEAIERKFKWLEERRIWGYGKRDL